MRIFIKNIASLALAFVAVLGIISCETDFENIESGVLKNNLTTTGEVPIDVKITPIEDLGGVRADNIEFLQLVQRNIFISPDYWLGNYTQNIYSKSIKAGFVSQLSLPSVSLETSRAPSGIQSFIYFLDKVVLKLPYGATATGATDPTNGDILYRLDTILKTSASIEEIKLGVYENTFFLNTLNPSNPADLNTVQSNFQYFFENDINEDKLISEKDFSFVPDAADSKFFFDRINREDGLSSTSTLRDSIVIGTQQAPFLVVPLDLKTMKEKFWDNFDGNQFANNEALQEYFKGIIIQSENEAGALVNFDLNEVGAEISFLYSIVEFTNSDITGISYDTYNFPLGGIKTSTYDMSAPQQETSSDNFIVQGTDGSNAEIEILGVNITTLPQDHPFLKYADKDINNDGFLGLDELNELNDENGNPLIIINDASLQFYVNENINSDAIITPQRLYLYKDTNFDGTITPTNISDAYESSLSFGGNLSFKNDEQTPDSYTFKITDFISDFIDGSNTNSNTKLLLKVFNEVTDEPVINVNNNNVIRFSVDDYNWNPRSVVLYNETAPVAKKAQLAIKYTELNK